MKFPRLRLFGIALFCLIPALRADMPPSAPPPPPALSVPAAEAPADPAKEAEVRQLLQLMGVADEMKQMVGQTLTSFRKAMPNVPDAFWEKFQGQFDPEELIRLIIPVYEKYYTKEDLDGLIVFYQTPLGRKVTASLPQISSEAMAIGRKWGQAKGAEIVREIQEEKKDVSQ